MELSVKPARDRSWLVALATLSLSVSLLIGRFHGSAVDFAAGFFLGIGLAVSAWALVLAFRNRSRD